MESHEIAVDLAEGDEATEHLESVAERLSAEVTMVGARTAHLAFEAESLEDAQEAVDKAIKSESAKDSLTRHEPESEDDADEADDA